MFRRDAVVALGGLDARLGSFADGYLARKIALTHGFCFAPELVATWCIYNDSVSRQTALQVAKARECSRLLPQRIAADPAFPGLVRAGLRAPLALCGGAAGARAIRSITSSSA